MLVYQRLEVCFHEIKLATYTNYASLFEFHFRTSYFIFNQITGVITETCIQNVPCVLLSRSSLGMYLVADAMKCGARRVSSKSWKMYSVKKNGCIYCINLLYNCTWIPTLWCILPNTSKYSATDWRLSTWVKTLTKALETRGICFWSMLFTFSEM